MKSLTEFPASGNPSPVPAILHALIGKSLVHAETKPTGEQRFLLLETTREFALEQLRAHGEEDILRQRHFTFYLHLFRTGDSHSRGPEAQAWLARLEPEQENLDAALQWALNEGRYTEMDWLRMAAGWFWFLRGRWYEQGQWLAQLLPHRESLPLEQHLNTLISVHTIGEVGEAFQPLNRWQAEMLQLLETGLLYTG